MVTKEYVAAVVKAGKSVTQLMLWNSRRGRRPSRPMILKTQSSACCTSPVRQPMPNKAVEAFLGSIKDTLKKHVPIHTQGPLISNALSTVFQFQMSVWHMIGDKCILPPTGEALGLVWPGRHCPGHSQDVPQELCSDVSSTSTSGSCPNVLQHLQAGLV